ncbi:uncharacterized protein G2W53_029393 [Senna tora]|uniref:Uncharacterized protein n=1 Tax=Senna tora TaxID=362788 RepID=A0A834T467_9FABA|nr:uncharacterized protein G2W53_029393 [Senna tora]
MFTLILTDLHPKQEPVFGKFKLINDEVEKKVRKIQSLEKRVEIETLEKMKAKEDKRETSRTNDHGGQSSESPNKQAAASVSPNTFDLIWILRICWYMIFHVGNLSKQRRQVCDLLGASDNMATDLRFIGNLAFPNLNNDSLS